ncbi:hypothetical protein [Zunongwangia profunda]|jgi:hypothetical protein|uniref:hypothetical protein n=1 Tax=Zunongwangia profunda TaxID=398743 RepID=UPI00248E9ADB|nr:hypothetical protein [Zunongwangia profunda]|tara:strand:+ start:5597 stop:5845 length:249 start_codon:yes stop_codon:yes gene_type:complete
MKVGDHVMRLNPHIIQKSANKGNYRVIKVAKDLSQAPQWVGKTEKFHWIITIKYIDSDLKVDLYFDYYDQCYKKEKVTTATN